MKAVRCLALMMFVLGFANETTAALLTWEASLNGAQENPANTSPATGFGTVTFDTATNILTADLSWSGLTGEGVQAHIHCCTPPTGNAGIALDLWLTTDPRQPATGSFSNSWDLDLVDPFRTSFQTGLSALAKFAVLQAAMDAPLNAYFNIHTDMFPGGEIRGNLAPAQVPEPSTVLLLALGAGAIRWRRARK